MVAIATSNIIHCCDVANEIMFRECVSGIAQYCEWLAQYCKWYWAILHVVLCNIASGIVQYCCYLALLLYVCLLHAISVIRCSDDGHGIVFSEWVSEQYCTVLVL